MARRLLVGGAYSDLSVNGAAFIRGWRFFEVWRLLEEIQYFLLRKTDVLKTSVSQVSKNLSSG